MIGLPASRDPVEPSALRRPGDVAAVLAHRRWQLREQPFRHVVARDVFVPDVHAALAARFAEVLRDGLSETPHRWRFSRITGYDAYTSPFQRGERSALRLFTSRAWHELLAGLFGVAATGDLRGGLHHHRPGSRDGTIHNDFNPGWFVDAYDADGINLWDPAGCSYHFGTGSRDGAVARRTVRAVAMIYYLHNPPWRDGDGGETGLYRRSGIPVGDADVRVPPINNSLIAFECTPGSLHCFLSNRRSARNSVILWLHRTAADAAARWGEDRIVPW